MHSRDKKTREKLGKNIQKIRERIRPKMTQDDLAEIVGVSRTHIGHIEQGRKTPSLEVLDKIARALKISASELLNF